MRAVLTNFGTTGDVQPFLALAIELLKHGHQPIVALSPNFGELVNRLGLEFVPIGPDLEKTQRSIITELVTVHSTLQKLRFLYASLVSVLPQMFSELRAACRGADVLISGPVQPAGQMIHELTGIPFVSVQLDHFGGGGRPIFQQATASLINPVRARLGLGPLSNPLTIDANSKQLALYAMSRHVIPQPLRWPSHYHMTGYFFFDDQGWQPNPGPEKFIKAGEPPVILTLGSTTYADASDLTDQLLEAVKQADCRAIIQHGWGRLAAMSKLPAHVHAVGYTPHSWLFPRAACIVHHGGVGTAAAAFRSGVPSIFITHGPPIRACLAQELGCAGPPIPYWQLSAEKLGVVIKNTLNSPRLYRAAAALGEKIRAERGVATARHLIEQLLHDLN
jgi:sterol 3beta-glucosyltransferase